LKRLFKDVLRVEMESQYLKLMRHVLENGEARDTRNGPTRSVFGTTIKCNLQEGFPLLTTKKMFWRGIVEELAWFLRGSTDVEELRRAKVHIWDGNSESRAYDAGPVYGFQWRHSGATYTDCHQDYTGQGVDQIKTVIDLLKEHPTSRRIVLNAWAPAQQAQMCLPPCHVMYQWYVDQGRHLSCIMTQRSSDVFLGLPFNIASTALLTHLLAHQTGLNVGSLTIHVGDAHIYADHVEACRMQLARAPLEPPRLVVHRCNDDDLWNVQCTDVSLKNYQCRPRICAAMKA